MLTDTSKTRDTRLVHDIMCLFIPQLSTVLIVPTHRAELTWLAGYIWRWFTHPQLVTHPSTNSADVDQLTNVLPLSNGANMKKKTFMDLLFVETHTSRRKTE